MLFDCQEPMTFIRRKLTFDFSESLPHGHDPITALYPHMQRACLRIMQDRSRTLPQRLIHLGELIQVMDIPYRCQNAEGIRAVLPFSATSGKADSAQRFSALSDTALQCILSYARDLLKWVEENNVSLQDRARSALELLEMTADAPIGEETVSLWHRCEGLLAQYFPDNERMLEQILVNHLCYDSFPLSGDRHTLWDSYLSLCTAYLLLRVLSVCHLTLYEKEAEKTLTPTQAYADIVAALFRMVSHTNFTHNAAILARRFHYDQAEHAFLLCRL